MCNRYGYKHPYQRLLQEFSDLGPVRWNGAEPNAPRLEIRPTDKAPIIREGGDGALELAEVRWGFIPANWTGTVAEWQAHQRPKPGERRSANPMTNARAETIGKTSAWREAYATRRCLVPATHYFEWSLVSDEAKGRKTMFRFTVPAQEVFAFPGVWSRARAGADGVVDSFALLTSAPGPDQAPYHDRQPVILERSQWADWLNTTVDLAPSFKGSPAGTIAVEYVSGPKPPGEAVQPDLF
ncbi:MAG TPA: SOS response-associated peptidase [Caulobacteraceae bacterium]|nr:SOS response-associated peptidase [Caulobacteraceae bacterium]